MNKELLDKLQFQAAAQVNPLLKDREWQRVYIQKYTELIVREAMMVVEGFTIEQEVALDQYEEYEASAVLKEHFGVEE